MKSGTNTLRYLLLVLVLSTYCLKAMALSAGNEVNMKPACIQYQTVVKDLPGTPDTNGVRKNVTPVIILTLVPYQGQIAQLSWTIDPTLPGTFYVERFDATNGWVVVKQLPYDASPVFFYNDTVSFPYCTATNFTYQIRFISAVDNVTSSTEIASLSDLSSPVDVKNLNVSITPNRFPIITWTPVTGDDISGYRIQRFDGNAWPIVTNVPDGTISFIDQSVSDVCDKSYKYVVVTIDRCNIPSAPVYEKQYVQTLKFESSQPGQCDRFSNLSWNSFRNMPGGLGGYKVYRSDGSTTIEVWDTKDTVYVDNFTFKDGLTYTYSAKAYSVDGLYSSSSCLRGWPYNGIILPDTVYITQVSVEADRNIRVGYHLYPDGSVEKLILERSDNGGTTFKAIDSIPSGTGIVPQDYFFIDSTVNVHSQSYYYRLVAIDNCGFRTPSMYTSRSIWLQCATSETQNSLEWNKYEYWMKGVKGYDIYRTLIGDPTDAILLDNVDQNTVTFTDLLSNYDHSKPACYWVEGNENPGNFLNNPISVSNTCCIIKEPILYLPNAFHPDGTNKRFRPVPNPFYVDAQTFKMTIFSRWGQQLYETSDMVNGWDGNVNGQAASAGLYSYIISYKSPENKEYTKRGTVLLIR